MLPMLGILSSRIDFSMAYSGDSCWSNIFILATPKGDLSPAPRSGGVSRATLSGD